MKNSENIPPEISEECGIDYAHGDEFLKLKQQ